MEYINPTAVAGMAGPRDMSMPGAGWGLLEGFQRQQDRDTAYQLLQMAADSQLLNQAQERFKFDSLRQMQPLLYEEQGFKNKGLALENTKKDHENRNLMDERTMRHLGYLANAAQEIGKLEQTNPEAARQQYDVLLTWYKKQFPNAPLSLDDLNFQPGVTIPNLMKSLEGVKYFDLQSQAKRGLQQEQNVVNERMNNEDNVTSIINALIQANSAQEVARISASLRANRETMATLISEYMDTLENPEMAKTPRGKALIAWLPSFVAGMAQVKEAARTDQARPRASDQAAGQLEGIGRGAAAIREQQQNPGAPRQQPTPQAPMPPSAPQAPQGPVPSHSNDTVTGDPDWDEKAPIRSLKENEERTIPSPHGDLRIEYWKGNWARAYNPKTGQYFWVKRKAKK